MRLLAFIFGFWVLAVIPWLVTKALCTGNNWIWTSIYYASLNTLTVMVILFGLKYLSRFASLPNPTFVMPAIFVSLSAILMIAGYNIQEKIPTVWEGVGFDFFILSPLTMWIDSFRIVPYPFIAGIILGSIYYFSAGLFFSIINR